MTTAATSLLGLALPVTGELSGTWGDTVNNSITSLLDTAVAGTTTLSTDGDVTLTTTTLASNQARQAILLCSGARTALRTITAPAQSKIYTVINATTGGYSVKVVGVGPTTGVTIVAGESAVIAWNGSDFIKVSNASGASTVTDLTVTNSATLSYGTANGVLYLNGSKVATSGSALTFDGTTLTTVANSNGANVEVLKLSNIGSGDNTQASLAFYAAGTKYAEIIGGYSGAPSLKYNATTSIGYHQWQVNGSEQMRLTSTGLGIGTSSPAYKLDVNGVTRLGAGSPAILAGVGGAFAGGQGELYTISTNPMGIGTTGAASLKLYTNSTLQATLDSSGNLGLGVTPSAWAGKAFQIGNASNSGWASVGYDANGKGFFATTAYNNTGSSWTYTATGFAATLYSADAGAHKWYTAASGTAGNAITFTQTMTLDASGNLGIGTSSPGAKLDVNGTIYSRTGGVYTDTLTAYSGSFISVNAGSSYFAVTVNSSERARIDSSGNFNLATGGSALQWSNASNNCYIAASSGILQFATGTAGYVERARIDSSGNLLVGDTNSYGKVYINGVGGTTPTSLYITSSASGSTDYAILSYNAGSQALLTVRTDGVFNTGAATNSPVNLTTANAANVYIGGSSGTLYKSTSSRKYKRDIETAWYGLEDALKLRPVTYKQKTADAEGNIPDTVFGGLIAEEVHEAGLSEFVVYAEDGTPDALAYGPMVSLCLKAIQEQQALIETLTARVAQLEAKGA